MDDKLKKILERCKCSVTITVNEHRDVFESAKQALEKLKCLECPPELEEDVRDEMIRRNQIVNIQVYPDTPIGFYDVYHWDLDKALDEILKAIG